MESSTLFPKIQRNHMLPSRCNQEPCRNIEVSRWETWRPGSVTHTSPAPIGKRVPGGTAPVNSPAMRPRSQTDLASESVAPAPWTDNHARTFSPMMVQVTYGACWVSFSSWYGNTALPPRLRYRVPFYPSLEAHVPECFNPLRQQAAGTDARPGPGGQHGDHHDKIARSDRLRA